MNFVKLMLQILCLVSVGVISGCSSLTNWFDSPRQGQAAEVTTLATIPKYYTVQKGDTLPLISRRYGISERAIILWNNLQAPYQVKVGQKLQFFAPSSTSNQSSSINNDSNVSQENKGLTQQSNNQTALIQNDTPVVQSVSVKKVSNQADDASVISNASNPVNTEKQIQKEQSIDPMPVKQNKNNDYYVVEKGDTLITIARAYDLTLTQIAAMNQISPPYNIYVGDKLLVNLDLYDEKSSSLAQDQKSMPVITAKTLEPKKTPLLKSDSNLETNNKSETLVENHSDALKITQKPAEQKVTDVNVAVDKKINTVSYAQINWQLPISGTIINDNDRYLIEGKPDQSVNAAANGKVIYAGVGIDGYGNMVIIDQGNQYLSAYGNLASLDVKEGDQVNMGQVIGTLGKFSGKAELSFEIRYQGNLISPDKIFNSN